MSTVVLPSERDAAGASTQVCRRRKSVAQEERVSPSSIVLVHAHTLYREGLRHNISATADFRIVGEASNGQQAIQVVDNTDPDMVLMEVDLPGINGLEVARALKRAHPHIGIMLLSSSMDGRDVVKAIRAGVAAYVPRNIAPDRLLSALRHVRQGEYPINELVLSLPDVAAQVLGAFRQMAVDEETQNIYSPLSPRELQVLELVADGRSNKEIAANLDISNQTVKNHVSSILRKLAVNDRTQAVVYAMRRGWIKVNLPGDV
jgi:DNA-binding NarL/FixJ family response regulator